MPRQVITDHPTGRQASHSLYVQGCRCAKCRAANAAYSKRYYHGNLSKARAGRRASTAKYLTKNPEIRRANEAARRAKKLLALGSHTIAEWLDLCTRYGNRCLVQGCEGTALTRDHVVPLARGGSDSIDNIQPLCQSCNARKGIKVIDYRAEVKESRLNAA